MKWINKEGKKCEMESGTWNNPRPSTERGKRRHEKRNPTRKAEVEKLWR